MPYQKHNRYISKEQFADGTTIDGSRIDTALQDVQELVNSIPKGDLKNRYTQTQFVMGWSPAKTYAANESDTSLPWTQAVNDVAQLATVTGGNPAPPDAYQNPQRAKGYAALGINPLAAESGAGKKNGAQYIWSVPIHFGKSVIIKSLKVFFCLDTESGALYPYNNLYAFTDGNTPEGAPDANTRDVSVQLLVDRPVAYGSEDRKLNQIIANKTNFKVNAADINQTVAAPTSDMFPSPYPGGNLSGQYFDLTVNEPIPAESRVRVAIIIPRYTAYSVSDETPYITSHWTATPWLQQYYSATLTVLEELER